MAVDGKNVSAVLYEKQNLKFEETDLANMEPKEGEVLLEMKYCGICGTDMQAYNEGLDEQYVSLPVVLGHESSGIVYRVGPGVSQLKQGDRVAVELGLPCRKCDLCKRGKYNLCKPWSFGGLQKYLCYAADFCHKIPDNMTLEEAALIEPLAVGVRAVSRAGVTIGSHVLICAAGAIGLSSLLAAKAVGATRICVTDISEFRLDLAKKMGATDTVLVEGGDTGIEIARKVTETVGGQVNYSIECSGVECSLQAAIYATKSGGVVAPVALDPPDAKLPLVNAATREIDIRGVFSYCNNYPPAIAMVGSGKADPSLMITHRYPLRDLLQAIDLIKSRKEGVLKVMIQCDA